MNEQFAFNFGFKKEPIHSINFIKNKICEQENIVHLDKPNIVNHDLFDLGDGNRLTNSFSRLSIYSFFYSPFNKKCTIQSLSDLLDNSFYNDESKIHIIRIYSKIKKCYNIFSRLARNFKWNRMKVYDNNYDLCMNNLSDYKKTTLIEIAEDNVRYIFRITDMIKIFNNALTSNYEMFAEPQEIKNPYTNKEISMHNLYNIYYTIKYSNIIMPTLVNIYYLSNFDIDELLLNNEEKIRDMSIVSYTKNLNGKKLNKIIREMFERYRYSFRLKVNNEFPMEKLNEIFLPFAKLYIQIRYTLSRTKRTRFVYTLKNKLMLFCKYAPLFGRKIIKINNNKKQYFFNSNCKTFDELKIIIIEQSEFGNIIYEDDSETSDSDSSENNEDENNIPNIIVNENNDNNEDENNIQNIIVNENNDNNTLANFRMIQHPNWNTARYLINNDPISLYNYNDNTPINTTNNIEEEIIDSDDDEEEGEVRPFPYNYDSH